jgi:hypothetical protein
MVIDLIQVMVFSEFGGFAPFEEVLKDFILVGQGSSH